MSYNEEELNQETTDAQLPKPNEEEVKEISLPTNPLTSETVPEMPITTEQSRWQQNRLDLSKVQGAAERVKQELRKVIIGQEDLMEQLLIGLFTSGHVLLEGVPGIAKTLTAKLLAQTIATNFSRIQFTPDLMPTDVVGTNVFNLQDAKFTFKSGPIFSNIVLIDEINRAPAKTQAALFEVMEEAQVTVDGETHPMSFPFFVIATQNPIEQEGTYKLPEAQLDRFLFKITLTYPTLAEERAILGRFRNDFKLIQKQQVQAVFSPTEIKECQALIEQVQIKDESVKSLCSDEWSRFCHPR